jgi:simple sugar transport system substrate-binding protein
MRKSLLHLALLLAALMLIATACGPKPTKTPEQFVFGLLMVGPYNDQGWSQAHYEAGQYVEEKTGAKMVYIDKVNPADRAGTTPAQLGEELVAQGAKLVIFNSDDMKDSATEFAKAHPDIFVIMASGDQVWKEGKAYEAIPNMTNIMGRMEYGKMMAGCAAALTTKTGQIGYLGPLINDETRRLASSAFLGAKYCWTNVLGKDAADLKFKVTWIGFWFNIPGVTSDPTQVADEFFNTGYDVVLSGIDTTEATQEAIKFNGEGKTVFAIPYDYVGACEGADTVCLGVPYFNWGPAYAGVIQSAADGTFKSEFQWNGPDWSDINNKDTSAVGFVKGAALSADAATQLDKFIADLAGGLNLWTGPINLQDGSTYLADGVVATDQQVWYLPQLLEGMEGQSVSQ